MEKVIYQAGNLSEFAAGDFYGILTAAEFVKYGNTGIGTFEGGNGEMLVYEGKVYKADENFLIQKAAEKELVSFANVAAFEPEISFGTIKDSNIENFSEIINPGIQQYGDDKCFMLKAEGIFSYVKVRSEKGQNPPYEPLNKFLLHAQVERVFEDVKGMLIALYCPKKYASVNAEGWHFHFVTSDFTFGGHVLEFQIEEADVQMECFSGLQMI